MHFIHAICAWVPPVKPASERIAGAACDVISGGLVMKQVPRSSEYVMMVVACRVNAHSDEPLVLESVPYMLRS